MEVRVFLSLCLLWTCNNWFGLVVGQSDQEAENAIASCDTICSCVTKEHNFFSIEFRAICKGNGTKGVVLTDKLFESETAPDLTRRVYVRIKNFTQSELTEDFLSRWMAYSACSLDIWYAGKIKFPLVAPPNPKAQVHIFAGVGVVESKVEEFPQHLFQNRDSAGLKLIDAHVNTLNLHKLDPRGLNYLTVKNSVIKVFEGDASRSLTLVKSTTRGEANILFQNSEIGYMSTNALHIGDYKGKKASVKIKSSTIGILDTSAIKVGKGMYLDIDESTLSYVLHSAINFIDGRKYTSSIVRNIIGLEEESLRHLTCDSSLQVKDNLIYSKNMLSNCIPDINEQAELSHNCNESLQLSNYLDQSCLHNQIFIMSHTSKSLPEPLTTQPTTTLLPTTTTSTTTTTTTRMPHTTTPKIIDNATWFKDDSERIYSGSASKIVQNSAIPQGLFYLVLGLCLCLIVIVIVLSAIVISGKTKSERKETISQRKVSKTESIKYDDPGPYFFPSVQPSLKFNTDSHKNCLMESDIDERYHGTTLGKKKQIELVEDDTHYVDMK